MKTYLATVVARQVHEDQLATLMQGVDVGGTLAVAQKAEIVKRQLHDQPLAEQPEKIQVRLCIQEGRYHIVKRMMHAVRLEVCGLHREAVGPMSCANLGLQREGDACLVPSAKALELIAHCGRIQPGLHFSVLARAIYHALWCGRLLCQLRRGVERPSDGPRLEAWLRRHWTLQGPCFGSLRELCPGITAPCLCEASRDAKRVPTF